MESVTFFSMVPAMEIEAPKTVAVVVIRGQKEEG